MNQAKFTHQGLLRRLLKRTGPRYHIIVIAFAQLISYAGASLGAYVIQVNARFTPEQLNQSFLVSFVLITLGNLALLAGAYFFTKDVRIRIEQWQDNQTMSGGQIELNAWRQVTSLAWRYGSAAIWVSVFIDILPLLAYQYFALRATPTQIIYTVFGGIISAIVILILAIFSIEYLLQPMREALLPQSFEVQLAGAAGVRLRQKFIVIIMALITVSILLLGPLGYQKINTVVYEAIGSTEAILDFQTQSVLASIVAISLGALLAFMLSQSISEPLKGIIQVFSRIEKGDLKQRAQVISTDEMGELAVYFNRMLVRLEELQQSLEKRVEERTEQLRASNEVGRIASTLLDPNTVIGRVVNLISTSFNYYYVAIFLVVDNGRYAELRDATGTAGEILKARRHRLQVGGKSMVGMAISSQLPQVALDVGEAAVRFNNPLLPNTRSEVALPLIAGDRVIGALNVQSTREADFRQEDISTLQNMANQVAIAIENARLFQEMEQALDELRQANREYVVTAWADKLKSRTLEFSSGAAAPIHAEENKEIAVPLNLRDQSIGQIRLQTEEEWTPEDQAWVEALATQVAISLENARLIEESQQSALRERLSASIVQKIWSTNSVDGILQATVRELGRALEASDVTIELKVDD